MLISFVFSTVFLLLEHGFSEKAIWYKDSIFPKLSYKTMPHSAKICHTFNKYDKIQQTVTLSKATVQLNMS